MIRTRYDEGICDIGRYIVKTRCTVREAAKKFACSKSTVHYLMTKKLPKTNFALYKKVDQVLQTNKEERAMRGGLATKMMYINKMNACDTDDDVA